MEAIILAGGFGTRLKHVIHDIPKPMAPINSKPFLSFLLEYLSKYNVDKIILATGYKHEIIEDYFGNFYKGADILYSLEDRPLGTGGAIRNSLEIVKGSEVIIVNGDTFYNVNLNQLLLSHNKGNADITLAIKQMQRFNRYGKVIIQNNRVVAFEEKKYTEIGNINGGIYVINKNIFENMEFPNQFSFENDFLEKYVQKMNFNAYLSDEYFIDIGIPEDYERAQRELPNIV